MQDDSLATFAADSHHKGVNPCRATLTPLHTPWTTLCTSLILPHSYHHSHHHSQPHSCHKRTMPLQVVYTQNIILAIVAEAYEEAKAKLGTAETSFLMLVLMRLVFLVLFIFYRAKMLVLDVVKACGCCTRGTPPAAPIKTNRPPGAAAGGGGGANGGGANGGLHGPGGVDGTGPDVAAAGPRGSNKDTAAAAPRPAAGSKQQWRGHGPATAAFDDWAVTGRQARHFPLQSTNSVAELPVDVEAGLRSVTYSRQVQLSQVALLPAGTRTSSQQGPVACDLPAGPAAAAAGAAALGTNSSSMARPPPQLPSSAGSDAASGYYARGTHSRQGGGVLQRLSSVLSLGERHSWRMYKDVSVASGSRGDSWVEVWKRRYWRPWCVARTGPVLCLSNLYQDFASYKLKEFCTWQHLVRRGGGIEGRLE